MAVLFTDAHGDKVSYSDLKKALIALNEGIVSDKKATFSTRLKAKMIMSGTSIQALADAIGLTYSTVYKYQIGTSFPKPKNLGKICTFFNTPSKYLLYGEGSSVVVTEVVESSSESDTRILKVDTNSLTSKQKMLVEDLIKYISSLNDRACIKLENDMMEFLHQDSVVS